ncbi:MAG: septum formation protein Maf [Saprospiraceae bacterium]|nr:septum formation protein Maf [Saprospiraceae bacterium]
MKGSNVLKLPILLGSASPRRKHLLQEAGFRFRVVPADIDEVFPEDMPPREVPVFLAEKKAEALAKQREKGEIILTADSVVILKNQVLGKPNQREEAVEMLMLLSGRPHEVITGVTLLNETKKVSFSALSRVHFSSFSLEEVEYYVDHYKPYDKAGSYGIQEWLGWCKVVQIEGSYSNIMGLPVAMVYDRLHDFLR